MSSKPRVSIEYCPRCGWLLRAAWLAQELLTTFERELGGVELIPSELSGTFEIRVDAEVVWNRKRDQGFPQAADLKRRVRDRVAPERSLGHSDPATRAPGTSEPGAKEPGTSEPGASEAPASEPSASSPAPASPAPASRGRARTAEPGAEGGEPATEPRPSASSLTGPRNGAGHTPGRGRKHDRGLTLDVVARTPPAFTSFTQRADAAALAASGARVTSYRVERVDLVRGPLPAGIEVGRPLWRAEAAGQLPVPDAPFIGATTHAVYVDSATRAELASISAGESGPVAVLIPIRKTAEWWALASEQRQAYVMSGAPNGHLAIGRRYAARIYRRLYQARYLPGSEWDFLTYFEFPASEASAFTDLLAELRDVDVNPEWGFVDREVAIWMERLTGSAPGSRTDPAPLSR